MTTITSRFGLLRRAAATALLCCEILALVPAVPSTVYAQSAPAGVASIPRPIHGNQAPPQFAEDPAAPATSRVEETGVALAATTSINDSPFFVQQQYRDFLNREPDARGFGFWTNEIEKCGSDAACREVKRINVSAAFFLSIEFKETGFLVYRLYKATHGRMPRLAEFIADGGAIGKNLVVGNTGWQQQIEANKTSFVADWTSRYSFKSAFPASMSPAAYVDKLFQNAGVTPSAAERNALVNGLSNSTETRESVLRKVAENQSFAAAESNKAFVLMQYFGYLRRNPEDAPDGNLAGFNFWLDKLNSFKGDYIGSEMVKAFLASQEYLSRFNSSLVLTKRSATPGETVEIRGSGFSESASATTTVTFTGAGGYSVKAQAVKVSATKVEAPVPFFVDPVSGAISSGAAVASVEQTTGGVTTKFGDTEPLLIRELTRINSTPGTVTLRALTQMGNLAKDAADNWQQVQAVTGNKINAAPLVGALTREQDRLAKVKVAIQQLASGQVQKVMLGNFGGNEVALNTESLRTLDRIYYSYLMGGAPARQSAALAQLKAGGTQSAIKSAQAAVDEQKSQDVDYAEAFRRNVGTTIEKVGQASERIAKNLTTVGSMMVVGGLLTGNLQVSAAGALIGSAGPSVATAVSRIAYNASRQLLEGDGSTETFTESSGTVSTYHYQGVQRVVSTIRNYLSAPVGQDLEAVGVSAGEAAEEFDTTDTTSVASQTLLNFSSLPNFRGSYLLDFGAVQIGGSSVRDTGVIFTCNSGNCLTETIIQVSIAGPNADRFYNLSDQCTGYTTSPTGGGCVVKTAFIPNQAGPSYASIVFVGRYPDGTTHSFAWRLSGSGSLP